MGARLAYLRLPKSWEWAPYIAGLAYAIVTPVGIAIGLGVRSSLSLNAAGGAAATGILDAISSGILIYTATVELMAHEFVFVSFGDAQDNARETKKLIPALYRTSNSTLAAWASSFTRLHASVWVPV